jgi:hypothetical protein
VNVGAPDLDAYYWLDPLTPQAGTRVAITGSYPQARYFSFHVYDKNLDALDSIYDQEIRPDAGGANPFSAATQNPNHRYTVSVQFTAKPAHPAANTLYANPAATGSVVPLVYRIYVPQNPAQPDGNVAFPQVQIQTTAGQPLVTQGACSTTPPAFGSALWQQFANADYPSIMPATGVSGATQVPTWTRSFGNQLGNQQNAYLGALISRQYGDLVVIHTRAPTFPDTRAGEPVYGHDQLRYWSLCTYDQNGQAGIGCAADYDAVIRGGSITYVISDPGERPANATAANGVTWLPWGGDQSGAQIVYRNMLPDPSFRYAAERITPTSDPKAVMGPYYPQAVYCAMATFERGGWRACFTAQSALPGAQSTCAARALPARGSLRRGTLIVLARVQRRRGAHDRTLVVRLSHPARLSIQVATRRRRRTRTLQRRALTACRTYTIALPAGTRTIKLTARAGRAYERRSERI